MRILVLLVFLFIGYGDVYAQTDTTAGRVQRPDTNRPKLNRTDSNPTNINGRDTNASGNREPGTEIRDQPDDQVRTGEPRTVEQLQPSPYADSVSKRPAVDTPWVRKYSFDAALVTQEILSHHPWMGFVSAAENNYSKPRVHEGKEIYFYAVIGLLLLFAILRNAFPKYLSDLFRVFFRTTLKQRQIREQLMQTPLPSLLMNGFFVISGGIYLAFVLDHYERNPAGSVWELAMYCSAGIAAAYFVKFIGLKILGVIFGVQNAANSYVFVVFIINKMIGILLLPFIVLLAFTEGTAYEVVLKLSFVLLAGMLGYRLILTFAAIRNQIKLNLFHFLVYVAAFEVAPLILVYRALLLYVPEMA